jgi:hypothetical protein
MYRNKRRFNHFLFCYISLHKVEKQIHLWTWKFIAIMSPKRGNFAAFAKYRGSVIFLIFIETRTKISLTICYRKKLTQLCTKVDLGMCSSFRLNPVMSNTRTWRKSYAFPVCTMEIISSKLRSFEYDTILHTKYDFFFLGYKTLRLTHDLELRCHLHPHSLI